MIFRFDKRSMLSFIFMGLVTLVTLVIMNPVLCIIIDSILMVFIFIKAKISFFTELSFILWFSYLQGVIYKLTGIAGGTLNRAGKTIPFYFNELSIVSILFMLTIVFFIWFTPIIENERKLYKIGVNINMVTGIFFMIVAIILIILVFPSIPRFSMNEEMRRQQGLSGIYGFALISLFISAMTIDLSFKRKGFVLGYIFIVFWTFGHGERVEALGFLSYYAIKLSNYYSYSGFKETVIKRKKSMLYIGGGLVLIIAMWIGMTRTGHTSGVNLSSILYNLIIQPTCGDVVYVFNCSVDMWKAGNAMHGYTYVDYLMQLIPGSGNSFNAARIMIEKYNTMGGGLFFTEAMMNFGIVGAVIMNIEFCLVYSWILKKINYYKAIFWIPIVIEIFRTAWYGRNGWILACFIETPLLFLGIKYVTNRVSIKRAR